LASYIKYDLRSLTPNLSHFRDNAIPDDLFRGSLDETRLLARVNEPGTPQLLQVKGKRCRGRSCVRMRELFANAGDR
jgi:hypothetical protein